MIQAKYIEKNHYLQHLVERRGGGRSHLSHPIKVSTIPDSNQKRIPKINGCIGEIYKKKKLSKSSWFTSFDKQTLSLLDIQHWSAKFNFTTHADHTL